MTCGDECRPTKENAEDSMVLCKTILGALALSLLGACSATSGGAWPQAGSAQRPDARRSIGLRQWVFSSFDYVGVITEDEVTEVRDHAVEEKTFGLDFEISLIGSTTGYIAAETIDLDIGESWRATVGGRYYVARFKRTEPFVFLELSHVDELEVEDEPDRDPMTFIGFGVGLVYPLGEHYGLEVQLKHEDLIGRVETTAGPFSASEEFNGMLGLVALRWYF
jgi:hypothetical protein